MKQKHLLKAVLICLCLLSTTVESHAQNMEIYEPKAKEQVLPTPTSRAYIRYPGYQPDMATGAASLSIPLYTAQEGDFSLPFALNYYSNGVKVMDNSFPIGYGWTLTPGLRITRTVLGKADEHCTFDYRSQDYTYEYLYKVNNRDYSVDAAHDLFSIHLPGENTTFLMEKTDNSWEVIMPSSPLKIVPQFNQYKALTGFEVKDERGIVYLFGGDYIEKDTQTGYETGWMLYRVTLPGATPNVINLAWEKQFARCASEAILNDYCCIQDYFLESLENPGMQGPGYMERMPSYDLDYWDIPLYMLKSITMPHQTIEFTNEKQNDEVYLRKLTVKNQAGSMVKECRLGTGGYTLGSLYISGEGTYEFDYYGGGYMDCRSQDFWGYYNGKPNTTTVPSFQIYIQSFASRLYAFNGADRRIDPEAMQNCQLKRVTYPTKGYMEWEYEPHRFSPRLAYGLLINGSNMSYLSEGGGLRVKRTVSCPGEGMPEVVRTYRYGANEDGLGVDPVVPELDDFVCEQFFLHDSSSRLYVMNMAFRQLLVGGTARCLSIPSYNPNVWYKVVTEYEGDVKTVYYYDYAINGITLLEHSAPGNAPSASYRIQCMASYSNLNQPGALLKKKTAYKKQSDDYLPVRKEEYTYQNIGNMEHGLVRNLETSQVYMSLESYDHTFGMSDWYAIPAVYATGNCWIELRKYYPATCTFTDYQGGDSVVVKHTYSYKVQDGRCSTLRSTTVADSRGDDYTDYVYYPADPELTTLLTAGQRSAHSAMTADNRILSPVLQLRKKGTRELMRKVTQYKNEGNRLYLPAKEYYKREGGNEEERITYQRYDQHGNLQEVVKDGTERTVYLWSYYSLYPVAKIEGATYADVGSWLGTSIITSLASNRTTVDAALTGIRNLLKDKEVQVTTYTYLPLVGMTSMTAPNGEKTTFLYDSQGRLAEVKDHNGKSVEQYDYHYKE